MKKLLAVLLAIMMLLPMFSTMTFAAEPDANATPGSEAYTAWLVSEGYTAIDDDADFFDMEADGKYYLANDIVEDISDANGSSYLQAEFTGILDGNGKTIYNWDSYLGSTISGTIKNVTFSDRVSEDGATFTVGWSLLAKELGDGAVIENVINYRPLVKNKSYYGQFAQGSVGDNVIIRNCKNYGDVTFSNDNNHKIGGFIGSVDDGSITFINCENYGDVTGGQAGGFVGIIDSSCTVTFNDCKNYGTITGVAGSSAYGVAGGFIGDINNKGEYKTYDCTISLNRCENIGDILRSDATSNSKNVAQGGLVGYLSVDTGTITLSIIDCNVQNCTVSGVGTDNSSTGGDAGALVGQVVSRDSSKDKVTIKNCTVSNVVVDTAAGSKFAFLNYRGYRITLVDCFANNVTLSDGVTEAPMFKNNDSENPGAIMLQYTEESAQVSINKAQQADNGDVRFIGTVDGLGYVELGYYIEYNGKTIKVVSDNTVYKALNNNYGEDKITADSLNANYLTAVKMTGVTAEFSGKINVTAYVKNADGTYVFGKTKGIEITAGAIGECL